jgi:cytochrome P450
MIQIVVYRGNIRNRGANMVQLSDQTVIAPPTVPGMPLIGSAPRFLSANGIPVDFLQEIERQYGEVVHFTVMGRSFYLVSSPDLIREILVERVQDFHKPDAIAKKTQGLGRFLGRGILTADYDDWRPQRKLIQPLMHARRIEQYADTMGSMGERLLDQWQDASERDIHADMTQVTMWIIAHTMFGMDVSQSRELDKAGSAAQKIVVDDLVSLLPAWLSGRDTQAAKLNDFLTELVRGFMERGRNKDESDQHDLLSLLMNTRDENGQPMSEEFLRDNILTMFFAGHETTANTLTWALYHLGQHPDVLDTLQAEVDCVLGIDQVPTLADLPNLPYTLMVIKETMRIQPTVGTFPRVTTEDVVLGKYQLRANSVILISPYVLHHNPQHWSAPDVYDPLRFSAENEPNIGKYEYMPFGGGPRICIGNHFALMEAQILLALITRRYQLHLIPGMHVQTMQHITAYPKDGLRMRLTKRS